MSALHVHYARKPFVYQTHPNDNRKKTLGLSRFEVKSEDVVLSGYPSQ